jgi:hypothetical protein
MRPNTMDKKKFGLNVSIEDRVSSLEMRMDIAERDIEAFKQRQFGITAVAKSKSESKLSEDVWTELTLPSGTWSKGNEVRVPDIGKFAVPSMESADRLGLQVTDRNLSLNANLSDIPLSKTTALLKPPPGLGCGPPAVPFNSGTNARGAPALPEPGMKPLSLASLFTASSPHMAPSKAPTSSHGSHHRQRSLSFEDKGQTARGQNQTRREGKAGKKAGAKTVESPEGTHGSDAFRKASPRDKSRLAIVSAVAEEESTVPAVTKKERGYVVQEDF